MAKRKKEQKSETRQSWEQDIELIKMLLVLVVNKLGVEKKEIAKALGISEATLSKMLNPKKYRS